jgi:hypothetical protein
LQIRDLQYPGEMVSGRGQSLRSNYILDDNEIYAKSS